MSKIYGKLSESMNMNLIKVNDYLIDENELLGMGQFGKVYKCTSISDGKTYAVKKISRKMISKHRMRETLEKNIESEIFLSGLLIHKNIVRLYNNFKNDDYIFLIMEYCKDGDLESFLQTKPAGYMSEQEAIFMMVHILEGFKVLVANSVLHLDIKPANILINNNVPKIGDFGLSQVLLEDSKKKDSLQSGSPLYMAPELLRKEGHSQKSDIWSLGILFYQMLYGETPWKGGSLIDLAENIKNKELKFPENPKRDEKIKNFIRRMLEKQVDKRINFYELFEEQMLNDLSIIQPIGLSQSMNFAKTSMNFSKDEPKISVSCLISTGIEQPIAEKKGKGLENYKVNVPPTKIDEGVVFVSDDEELDESKINEQLKKQEDLKKKEEEEERKRKAVNSVNEVLTFEKNIAIFLIELSQNYLTSCYQNCFNFKEVFKKKMINCLLDFTTLHIERARAYVNGKNLTGIDKETWKIYEKTDAYKTNLINYEAEFHEMENWLIDFKKQSQSDLEIDEYAKNNIKLRMSHIQIKENSSEEYKDDQFIETFTHCLSKFFKLIHFHIFEITEQECLKLMTRESLLTIKYLQIFKDNPYSIFIYFKSQKGKKFDFMQFFEENNKYTEVELLQEIKKSPWKIKKSDSSQKMNISKSSPIKPSIKESKITWD